MTEEEKLAYHHERMLLKAFLLVRQTGRLADATKVDMIKRQVTYCRTNVILEALEGIVECFALLDKADLSYQDRYLQTKAFVAEIARDLIKTNEDSRTQLINLMTVYFPECDPQKKETTK